MELTLDYGDSYWSKTNPANKFEEGAENSEYVSEEGYKENDSTSERYADSEDTPAVTSRSPSTTMSIQYSAEDHE
jgi:hypothetical protein